MKTIITSDKADKPYGFPQANEQGYLTSSKVSGPFGADSVVSASYALTASYAMNGGGGGGTTDTGSLLLTASAVGNIITFTKGDGTTFPVSVSGTSVDTGSFATTGSNTFYGLQTISSSTDLSALDIHVKDDILWTFRTYNDAYSTTSIGLASWIDNDGVSFLGTETDRPLHLYNNANYQNPTLLLSSSGVTISTPLTVNSGITGSLQGTASWAESASIALYAPPGGVDTQIQFNQNGNLAGDNYFTFNYASQSLQQGNNASAIGAYSHAEGVNTIATGEYSHAEGGGAQSLAENSHAEGYQSLAYGYSSHAEGYLTRTYGTGSHSEGFGAEAVANYSHAEGLYTYAIGEYQHVQGQYNATSSVQSAFIVGNGTDDNNRSNLIFAAGNEVQISGSILFGGGSSIESIPASSGDGYGYATLQIKPDTSLLTDQYIILDPTSPNHIHIRAGGTIDASTSYLYLGGENNHVKVDDYGTIEISSTNTITTKTGSNQTGLYLDFVNGNFGLVNNPNAQEGVWVNSINTVNKGVYLGFGDSSQAFIGITPTQIRTNYNNGNIGLNIDFTNNTYSLGDYNGLSNYNYFNINDTSGEIILTGNNNRQGLYISHVLSGKKTTIGDWNDLNNKTKVLVDDDTQTVSITGSLNAPTITGSLYGTASWAENVLTASYVTGSIFTSTNPALSASYALTASYALNTATSVTPGDGNQAIQFNSASVFSGSAKLKYDYVNSNVILTGSLLLSQSYISKVDYIDFTPNKYDTVTPGTIPTHIEGRLFYDTGSQTLCMYNNELDVTLNIGQESWLRARNQTGVTITNGSVVKINGAIGNRPSIALAQSTDQVQTFGVDNDIIGMATHDIEQGTDGFVTTFGLVNGVDTSAFNAGDLLWVSQSAGQYTNIPPSAPYDKTFVGIVTRKGNANVGTIFVTPSQPLHFHDISSVSQSGAYTQGDMWMFRQSGSSGVWTNTKTLSGSYVISGSLNTNGSVSVQSLTASVVSASAITGSLFGTASWATNAVTASFAPSYVLTSATSSMLQPYVLTSQTSSMTVATASYILASNIAGNLSQIASGNVTASVTPSQFSVVSGSTTEFTVTGTGVTIGNAATDTHRVTGSLFISGGNLLINKTVDDTIGRFQVNGTVTLGVPSSADGRLIIYRSGGGASVWDFRTTGNLFANSTNAWEPYNQGDASHNFNIASAAIGNFNWSAGTNDNLSLNTQLMRLTRGGNLLIGTTTDAGFKLDVNGNTRITGSLTVSDTTNASGSLSGSLVNLTQTFNTAGNVTAFRLNVVNPLSSGASSNLVDIQTGGSSVFAIDRAGICQIPGSFGTVSTTVYRGLSITLGGGFSGNVTCVNSNPSVSSTAGNAFVNAIAAQPTFSPSSGTANMTSILSAPTVSQTGGASGIMRGLYINPTLTSAADFRAIEVNSGSLVMADSYLASGSRSGSLVNLSQTWNTPGGVAVGIVYNAIDTNSAGNASLMQLRRNGATEFDFLKGGSFSTAIVRASSLIESIRNGNSGGVSTCFNVNVTSTPANTVTATNADWRMYNFSSGFAQSSGTSTLIGYNANPTINQTGTANGITRGLYINPVLTSAPDWRAIETTGGSLIMADSYLASGSLSGSLVNLSQTWNTSGNVTGIRYNVTNTLSGATSNLLDLQVGGSSRVSINTTGSITLASGSVTMPNRPAFRVYGSGTINNLSTTTNGDGTLNSNNFATDYQQGTGFNASTGIFTAPVAGLYSVHMICRNDGNANFSQLAVLKNNSNAAPNVIAMVEFAGNSTMNHAGASSIARLAVGDTLRLKVLANTITFDGNDSWAVAYIG